MDIQDVDLNKFTKEITVLDGYSRKINYYNYDGDFLKSISTSPVIIYSLASVDSLNYILDKGRYPDNDSEPQLANARLLSSNLKDIYYSGIAIEKGAYNLHYNTLRQFWKFEEGVFFNKPYHDTIYRVTNDTIFAEYYLDLNGDNISYKDKLELTDEKVKTLIEKYAFLNGDFIELKDFVYLNLFYPKFGLHTIYSKRSGHIISGVNFVVNNPLLNFLSTPIAVYKENTMVVLLEPINIMNLDWESCPVKDKYPHLKGEFYSLKYGLTENDNPILMLYTLKEF